MRDPTAAENYETLAFALTALRRWQRKHGLLGTAVLTLKPEASPLVEAAIRSDGFDDTKVFLKAFADVLEIRA